MPDGLAKVYLCKFYFRKMFLYLKKHIYLHYYDVQVLLQAKDTEEKPQFQRLWKAQHTGKALNKTIFLIL